MPDEKSAQGRAKARTRALALVAHAASPTANRNEARNAAVKACKLIDEFKLLEGAPEGPSVLETIQKARDVAADPAVRETVTALGETARAGLDLVGKVSDLLGKRR